MGVHGDFVRRTAGLVRQMGGIVADLEAEHGPFRLFTLFTRSAHVPELGTWFLLASAGWMDEDCAGSSHYLGNFIKERVGPDEIRHLSFVVVKRETESPVSQIQRKLGWVIRDGGLVGDIAVEAPATWDVFRCLPNGEEFLPGDGPGSGSTGSPPPRVSREQMDDSVVPIEVQEKIISMARPANWAGEGSGVITPEACSAAIKFVSDARTQIDGLDDPRIGPSLTGAVALQWDFDEITFVAKISAGRAGFVHFQVEGPDFSREEGVALRKDALARLGAIAKQHVLS